ncbi:aromatic-ring-hydroxylating dioxygenase subunit beta [Immundisolibacter sp.]
MSPQHALTTGSALLYRQARLLDERRWQDWLGLFTEDCEYWVPAWLSEQTQTEHPDTQVSLIYYDLRSRLADRVWRVQSGTSVASDPMPRTCHAITNIQVDEAGDDAIRLFAAFRVDYHWRAQSQAYFGHYQHTLRREGADWRIARQKISVLNDYIPTLLDFYLV